MRFLEQTGYERTRAALGPSVRREASWNGRSTSANVEWVVERAAFDRALLEDVAAAGIRVVIAPLRGLRYVDGAWQAQAGEHACRAGFWSRRGAGGRPGRRRHGPAAIALAQSWSGLRASRLHRGSAVRERLCLVRDRGDGRGSLQLVVAPPEAAGRSRRLADRLASVPQARAWLAGAGPCSPVSRTACRDEPGAGVGRASAHPDRRCGAGARPALGPWRVRGARLGDGRGAGGDHAPAPPADAALARAFYEERVEQAFLRFARTARDFYRLEERWREAPFWQARRRWPDDLPAHRSPSAGAPQIRSRPVIEDGFVVAREVIVTADQPRGVFQVDGVPLVPLLRAVQAGETYRSRRPAAASRGRRASSRPRSPGCATAGSCAS